MKLGYKMCLGLMLMTAANWANAVPVNISLTADNAVLEMHYCLTADSADPFMTGGCSNTIGFGGEPNYANWKLADSVDLDLASGEYWFIFTAVQFGDFGSGNPAAFLAEIGDQNGTVTDSTWQFSYNGFTWYDAVSYGRNDESTIWYNNNGGAVAGIDGAAEWIWGDLNFTDYGAQKDEALRFRTMVTVPEPGTLALLGLGLLGIGASRRKALS